MSFSISISEFIAVGQLAERLYKDVCLVRHASQELLALQNEVATSNTSINLLIADIKDKTSTLARSGEERVNVVNGVLAETKKTLLELEKFSQNFRGDQRNAGAFGKVKSVLSKAKYVGELSKIDALRARLQHQNGNLTLLLMCAGNSSLQRIETVDQKMNADITKLTKMMAQLTHEAPDDSGLSYKSPLTPNFLAQAENGGRRWFSYGFDEWLRAGQWWLMSSQGQLDPEITSDLVIPIQPYADLLKASSILLDILPRHPSIRLWDPTKEYLQFQLLADMLRDELNAIKTRGLKTPDLQSLQEADLRIWTETVTTVQLRPDAHGHRSSWEDANEEILWQGFGTFVYDRDFKPKACMILVLVSKNIDKARILVQNQRGFELISLRIDFNLLFAKPLPGDSGFRSDSISGNSEIEFYFPDCRKPLGDGLKTIGLGQIEISLSSKRDLGELSCTLRGIVFCQHIQGVQKDHALLHGVILLFIQAYGDVALGRKSLALHQKRRCLEFYKCEESSILHVAEMAAQEFSQHTELFVSNHPPRFVDFKQWRSAYNSDFDQPIVESQNMFDWAYGILIGPALLGLSLRAFDSMSFCSDVQSVYSSKYLDDLGSADHDNFRLLVIVAELAAISGATPLIQHLDFNYISINKLRNPVRWWGRIPPITENLPLSDYTYRGMSLLHFAVAFSPAPAVQILIDAGGDLFKTGKKVDLGFGTAASQVTVVDFALASENFDSLTLLVKYYSGIDLLQKSIYVSRFLGERSFVRAREFGNTYACGFQMLLDVVFRSDTGTTPKGREMQNFSQNVGRELFFCALAAENTIAAKVLAEAGVDVDGLDNKGHTALWYASRLWDVDLTEYILSKSSSLAIRSAFQPDEYGNTLLHYATMQGVRSANMYLHNLLALCKCAPDIDAPDRHGMSPLAGALICGNYTSAKALVLAGCKIDGYARLQRLKNLSVDGQLGVFDDTKLMKEKFLRENMEWCRHDPIWDDSDLAGMSPSAIEDYLRSDNYEEQRQRFLQAAVQLASPNPQRRRQS